MEFCSEIGLLILDEMINDNLGNTYVLFGRFAPKSKTS